MKQTVVEWLMNEIENRIVRRNPHNTIIIQTQVDTFNELFEKAKQMDREQIMDAIKFTIQDEFTKQTWKNGKCSHDIALNYYNNRFNK